jgi:LysM repeat protein
MKILKIFGVVVGLHVFALMLIFANPGCSSTPKRPPVPSDTAVGPEASPTVILPPPTAAANEVSPVIYAPPAAGDVSPVSAAPDAADGSIRFSPTRPGTAAASTLEAAPVAGVTPASTYTVVRGDSLWAIAHRNHLRVSELAKANGLRTNAPIRLGQKLIIPGKSGNGQAPAAAGHKSAKSSAAAAPRASAQTVKHIVKSGETLGGIARKYQVKVGEIATANNIADPAKIRPGMELIIPGWRAPTRHAQKSPEAESPPAAPAPAVSEPAPAEPAGPVVQPAPAPNVVEPAPADDAGPQPADEPPVIQIQNDSTPNHS